MTNPEGASLDPTTVAASTARQRGSVHWMSRISVGVVGAALTLAIIYANRPEFLAVYLTGLACWGLHEFYRAVRKQNAAPSEVLGLIACILFQVSALEPNKPIFNQFLPVLLALLMIAALIVELVKSGSRPIANLGATVLGVIYVGWLISFYTRLRLMDHRSVIINAHIPNGHVGSWLVILVCTVTWMGDIAGLVIGNWLGRNKLAPAISPAKTWEGAIGGVACSTLLGTGLGAYLGFGAPASVAISVLMGVFGLVGDLCESALKRNLGLKDFGTAFAAHGGVLDRIDSLLFTAPVAYYFILVFLSPR